MSHRLRGRMPRRIWRLVAAALPPEGSSATPELSATARAIPNMPRTSGRGDGTCPTGLPLADGDVSISNGTSDTGRPFSRGQERVCTARAFVCVRASTGNSPLVWDSFSRETHSSLRHNGEERQMGYHGCHTCACEGLALFDATVRAVPLMMVSD